MNDAFYFFLGLLTAFLVMHLVYRIWKKRIEVTLTRVLAPGVKVIEQGRTALDDLVAISKEHESLLGRTTVQVNAHRNELERLLAISSQLTAGFQKIQTTQRDIDVVVKRVTDLADVIGSLERRIQDTVSHVLTPGNEVIQRSKIALESLVGLGKEYQTLYGMRSKQLKMQDDEVKRLTTMATLSTELTASIQRIQTTQTDIDGLVGRFADFAEAVAKIEQHGVELLTKRNTPDIPERILVLVSKAGSWKDVIKDLFNSMKP